MNFSNIASINSSGATNSTGTRKTLSLGVCQLIYNGKDLGYTIKGEHAKLKLKIKTKGFEVSEIPFEEISPRIISVDATLECGIPYDENFIADTLGITSGEITSEIIGKEIPTGVLEIIPVDKPTRKTTFYKTFPQLDGTLEGSPEKSSQMKLKFQAMTDLETEKKLNLGGVSY